MNIHVPGQGAKVQGQFQTDCKKAQEAALLCATTHPEERQRCDKFFAAYRECRKAEHSRILEARGQGREDARLRRGAAQARRGRRVESGGF